MKCVCENNAHCDPVSGRCTCAPGWTGHNCRKGNQIRSKRKGSNMFSNQYYWFWCLFPQHLSLIPFNFNREKRCIQILNLTLIKLNYMALHISMCLSFPWQRVMRDVGERTVAKPATAGTETAAVMQRRANATVRRDTPGGAAIRVRGDQFHL